MKGCTNRACRVAASGAVVSLLLAGSAWGSLPGTIRKYAQLPQHMTGENIASDVDWRLVMQSTAPIQPNWTIADDFPSQGLPIHTVRWWGSYFPSATGGPGNEPIFNPSTGRWEAVVEEGFALSFFRDIPGGTPGGAPFSRPGELLGSYIAPDMNVTITPTTLVGWDGHRVWEYSVDLKNTHLDHGNAAYATAGWFQQIPGEVYWLSIVAENGHEVVPGTWQFVNNGDPIPTEHFWGWHTSPDSFLDVATMGNLIMPGSAWEYINWQPIMPQHGLHDMAFELLTIPTPGAGALLALAGLAALRRRGR
ncbi:MAG: hypothetical protein AB7G17_06990 [Phycisphaerales bacterium]